MLVLLDPFRGKAVFFFFVNNLLVRFISEEQPQVDIENNEELSNGHYCEFKRNSDSFHAELFNLTKFVVNKGFRQSGTFIVIDQQI